ncbi:MAG: DUF924 family protein [Pseudomonadales bacterium]
MNIATPEQIHHFWFGTLDSDGCADTVHRQRWFQPDAQFDKEIGERFAQTLDAAHNDELDHWHDEAASWLSFILLCDQFPRNMFRNHAKAFASDALARKAVMLGLERGYDEALTLDEKAFAFLPFEHSENRVDQFLSVGLYTSLRDHAPSSQKSTAGNYLRYAQQHRDVILRFDRFPHRNAALARASSAAELAYLADGGGFR